MNTIEFILLREKESFDKTAYNISRKRFLPFLQFAPETVQIKESYASLNRILFGGDIAKVLKIIQVQERKQANHLSLGRILQYYWKNVGKEKYFDQDSKPGHEIFKKMIFSYLRTKVSLGKELLFTEKRE